MGARNNPNDIINRARSNGFKSGLHYDEDKKKGLKEYDQATIAGQDQVLHKYAIWSFGFLNDKKVTNLVEYEAMLLCEGASLPEIHLLKDFWRFYKDQARGRINKRPTARSLKANAKSFNAGFKRRTGNNVPAETIAEINLWIGNSLVSEEDSGVVDVERPKYNYKPQDLDRNLKALWTGSDIKVRHERERFQFHFLLLLFCDSGARRGGLFTAGVPYKDFHLVLERGKDGIPRFFFQLIQRTVKNNKDTKNKEFGVARREHRLLRYNAVFFLIHFAIADGALDYDFFTRILEGKGDGPIEWNEAVQELPVCRAVDRNGLLTSKPMTFPVFERVLKRIFMVEYDYIRASMHMIRRELGKQLDNRYTETERSQHVLHKDNRIFGQSYVAFVSSCDGLAAFLREDVDHTAVDYFQGLERFHQPGMPVKLPTALSKQVQNSAELAKYDNEIKCAMSPDGRAKAQKARQNAIKRLREQALQEHRQECLKVLRKDRLINGCHATSNCIDPLNEVFPEKRRISEVMVSDMEEFSVMKDALRLLTMSSEKYHRDGEGPVDGSCPFCYEDVSRLPLRNVHIHHCRRKSVAQELGVLFSTLKFCYFCNEFYTPTQWEQDCGRHLSSPHVYCGSLTYRHTLLRPAFCLLCAQSTDLTAAERLRYWERDVQALDHIDQVHGWHWTCLHCNFVSTDKESGRDHLYDTHGYQFRTPKASATQCMAIDHQLLPTEPSSHPDYDQSERSLGVHPSSNLEDALLETKLDVRTLDLSTPPLEWPETADDIVDKLMDECISFPETPPSDFSTSAQCYLGEELTMDLIDSYPSHPIAPVSEYKDDFMMDLNEYKAPYYLLPTQPDTIHSKTEDVTYSLETTSDMTWEHCEHNVALFEEKRHILKPPTRQQIVIELKPCSAPEEYESFEEVPSTADKSKSFPQPARKRIKVKRSSGPRGPKTEQSRLHKSGKSSLASNARRERIRFTPDEDQLLVKLKAEPTLTWEKIHGIFNAKFPERRSLGALQVRYSTKLQ